MGTPTKSQNKTKHKSKKNAEASSLVTNIIVIGAAVPVIAIMSLYSLQNDIWVRGETYWLISRAAAVAAYLVLTATLIIGLLLSHPRNKDTWRWTPHLLSWHQSLMAALFILIGLHLFFTLADPKSGVAISQVWFPIHARYHPLAMVAGVFALYGLVAVMVSLGLRKVTKLWLPLHRMSWLVWLLVLTHGIFGGTDTVRLQWIYWGTAGIVAIIFYWRHWANNQRRTRRPARIGSHRRSKSSRTDRKTTKTPTISQATARHSSFSEQQGGSM